jgi:hypothetical protein
VSSVFILIKFLNYRSFLGGLFFSLFIFLGNLAVLNGAQDVLVVVLGDVGYDIFSVLLGTESQVSELATLIGEEGSEGLLGLHDEIGHESGVLDGGESLIWILSIGLGEHLDGNT